jgi:hypothetical protein
MPLPFPKDSSAPYDFSMEYLELMDFGEEFGSGAYYIFDFDEMKVEVMRE